MERTLLRTPEDLLAYLPYLLGFHPDNCLVALGMRTGAERSRVTFTLRAEIPPPDATDDMLRAAAGWLGETMQRRSVSAAAVVAFSPSAACTARFARILVDELEVRGVVVRQGIRADGQRWWPLLDERGARDDGVGYDVSNHPLVTSAVYQGLVALPDERAVEASIRPSSGSERVRVRLATTRVQQEFAERYPDVPEWPSGSGEAVEPVVNAGARHVVGLVRRLLSDRSVTATDEEIAWAGMYLLHLAVRDDAWSLIDRPDAARHVEIWRDLARRCDQELMVAPYTLLGFSAWLKGDGVLARHAVETALATDPSYTMAQLVAELLASATPPARWTPHPLTRTD